jgi:hypothetical protein
MSYTESDTSGVNGDVASFGPAIEYEEGVEDGGNDDRADEMPIEICDE